MTEKEALTIIRTLATDLLKLESKPINCNKEWAEEFTVDPGVYVFLEDDRILYVGETGSIRGRMKDVLKTQNHSFRRNIGGELFADDHLFEPADEKNKFPEAIEAKLNKFLEDRIRIKVLPTFIGLKELEERLIDTHAPEYNKREKRL